MPWTLGNSSSMWAILLFLQTTDGEVLKMQSIHFMTWPANTQVDWHIPLQWPHLWAPGRHHCRASLPCSICVWKLEKGTWCTVFQLAILFPRSDWNYRFVGVHLEGRDWDIKVKQDTHPQLRYSARGAGCLYFWLAAIAHAGKATVIRAVAF